MSSQKNSLPPFLGSLDRELKTSSGSVGFGCHVRLLRLYCWGTRVSWTRTDQSHRSGWGGDFSPLSQGMIFWRWFLQEMDILYIHNIHKSTIGKFLDSKVPCEKDMLVPTISWRHSSCSSSLLAGNAVGTFCWMLGTWNERTHGRDLKFHFPPINLVNFGVVAAPPLKSLWSVRCYNFPVGKFEYLGLSGQHSIELHWCCKGTAATS